jgi:hypothetical protein
MRAIQGQHMSDETAEKRTRGVGEMVRVGESQKTTRERGGSKDGRMGG